MSSEPGASYYAAFVAVCGVTLRAVNEEVTEPYMVRVARSKPARPQYLRRQRVAQDEPFHVPQAQAYCRGDYWAWDPKITTPPGL